MQMPTWATTGARSHRASSIHNIYKGSIMRDQSVAYRVARGERGYRGESGQREEREREDIALGTQPQQPRYSIYLLY
jgi:hypothetical protein